MNKQKRQEGTCRAVIIHENDTDQKAIARTRWYAAGHDRAMSAGRELAARRGLLTTERGGPYVVTTEYA
jgi:hypothetical protein